MKAMMTSCVTATLALAVVLTAASGQETPSGPEALSISQQEISAENPATRIERLILDSAGSASAIRTMFMVDRVRVREIQSTLSRTDRQAIRSVVAAHPNRVEALRVAVESNAPVYRRAEEHVSDVGRIIAAEVEGENISFYVD